MLTSSICSNRSRILMSCLLGSLMVVFSLATASAAHVSDDWMLAEGKYVEGVAAADISASALETNASEKGVSVPPIKTLTGVHFSASHPDQKATALGPSIYAGALVIGYSLHAPVDLPAGTIINRIVFYLWDNTDPADIRVSLYSDNPVTEGSLALGILTTTGTAGHVRPFEMTLSQPVVIDPDLVYRLRFEPGVASMDQRLAGVKIYGVTPDTFSDGFEASKSLLMKLGILPSPDAPAALQ